MSQILLVFTCYYVMDVIRWSIYLFIYLLFEPAHDKTYNKTCTTSEDSGRIYTKRFEPHNQKTFLRTCAHIEDFDQPAHLHSLIGLFTGCILDSE